MEKNGNNANIWGLFNTQIWWHKKKETSCLCCLHSVQTYSHTQENEPKYSRTLKFQHIHICIVLWTMDTNQNTRKQNWNLSEKPHEDGESWTYIASLRGLRGSVTEIIYLFIYLFILFSARAKRVLFFSLCHEASTSEGSAGFFFFFFFFFNIYMCVMRLFLFFPCVMVFFFFFFLIYICVLWGQHKQSECFFFHVLFYLCYETRTSEASVFFFFFFFSTSEASVVFFVFCFFVCFFFLSS